MKIGQQVTIAQGRFSGDFAENLDGIDLLTATIVSFDAGNVVVVRRRWPFGQRVETYARHFVFDSDREIADRVFGKGS
jgi:hypothetical protein